MKEVTAIVQARMGSNRLPGKVLMDLCGQTVLERVVRRLAKASSIGKVVIATSTQAQDDVVASECDRLRVACFRGDEQDVLGRYMQAAEQFHCEVLVRITADCPLIDPGVVDQVVTVYFENSPDLACNDLPATFPRGLDVEVFSIETLREADKVSGLGYQREHVTATMYERTDLFRIATVQAEQDFSHYRWTLDTAEDLELIREIYGHFGGRNDFRWREIIEFLKFNPHLLQINAHIRQKPVCHVETSA
ncbi:MAG TPA: glycosyltransferase family protein [Terriglobales bacterium]|nr:glycosyltransferase family protein [Terriglobales bacterium]